MKEIWLIRHGESIANAGAATENHVTIPLSQIGQEQAEQISLLFKQAPDLIITSPFTRTQQTAQPTIKRFPGTRHEVWEVQEFTYLAPGSCVNTTAEEHRERINEYWTRLDPDYIDGEGAESFRQFINRAQTAVERLGRLSDGLVVMFTHAQFTRAMRLIYANPGISIEAAMRQFRALPRVNNCEITKLQQNSFTIKKCSPNTCNTILTS